jgi:hypothetical protein
VTLSLFCYKSITTQRDLSEQSREGLAKASPYIPIGRKSEDRVRRW